MGNVDTNEVMVEAITLDQAATCIGCRPGVETRVCGSMWRGRSWMC